MITIEDLRNEVLLLQSWIIKLCLTSKDTDQFFDAAEECRVLTNKIDDFIKKNKGNTELSLSAIFLAQTVSDLWKFSELQIPVARTEQGE